MLTRTLTLPENHKVSVSANLVDNSGDPINVTSWSSSDLGFFGISGNGNTVEIFSSGKSGLFVVTASTADGPALQIDVTVPTGAVDEGASSVVFGDPLPR